MKRISNKTLLIIFLILAAIAVIFYFYDRNKGERTFRNELFAIDSARVTSFTIYPKSSPDQPFKLTKTGSGWDVRINDRSYLADSSVIANLLGTLKDVHTERVVATDRTGWKEFDLTDSASTRVVIREDNEVAADFRIGKVSFSQANNPYGYGRGQNVTVKSHIRMAGDDRVYLVDGFLSMMFSDKPTMYRNRQLLKLDRTQVTRMTFIYPGDSSFVLSKTGTQWMVNGQLADSAKTVSWLNSVSYLSNSDFADDETLPFVFPYQLRIEGNNMETAEVRGAFDPASKKYFVKSSQNTTAVFGSSNPDLFNKVFPGEERFLAKDPVRKQ